jgi:phosphodiesterase/alkaline phosphatase D-like protein
MEVKRMSNGFINSVRRALIILAAAALLSSATGLRAQDKVLVYAQAGDVAATSVVVWGRCNRGANAYLVADITTSPEFKDLFEFQDAEDLTAKLGPLVKVVTADTDYTGAFVAHGLRPDTTYYYRLWCVTRPTNGLATAETGPVGIFPAIPGFR